MMCRWVAYAGPEIYLEDLIFHQEHSIVSQSLAAMQSSWVPTPPLSQPCPTVSQVNCG